MRIKLGPKKPPTGPEYRAQVELTSSQVDAILFLFKESEDALEQLNGNDRRAALYAKEKLEQLRDARLKMRGQ